MAGWFEPDESRGSRPVLGGPGGESPPGYSAIKEIKGVRRVLYRLPEIIRAVAEGELVFVCEGEKDANRLASYSLCSTTKAFGASKWLDSYSEVLKGAHVVLLPDNDPTGIRFMQDVATSVSEYAASVKVVNLPGLGDKEDVSDWLMAGNTIEEFMQLVEATPLYQQALETASLEKSQPKDEMSLPFTDLGNARRFVSHHEATTRYCPERGQWLHWTGTHWCPEQDGEILRKAQHTASDIYREFMGAQRNADPQISQWGRQSASLPRMRAMVALAESQKELIIRANLLDRDPWALNVMNGTIDLRSGELRPHRCADNLTKLAPVEYVPEARSMAWEVFLEKVIPSSAVRDFLQRITGYTLTGITKEEVLFSLNGPPASGKSTFLEAVAGILGDYATATSFKTFTTESAGGNSASSDLARLAGKRLVRSSEIDKNDAFSEAVVKKLTGGDMITARYLYKEYFEYRPEFKIFIANNDRPRARDNDEALWRRIIEVPFSVGLGEKERDPSVKKTLLDLKVTGPAILAWAVKGCLAYQRIGLDIPDEVRAATDDYRKEMDPIADFMDECILTNPLARVENGELWQAYEQWCHKNGVKYGVSQKNLKKRLEQRGFRQGRDSRTRYWVGFKIRHDDEVLSTYTSRVVATTQASVVGLEEHRAAKISNLEFQEKFF